MYKLLVALTLLSAVPTSYAAKDLDTTPIQLSLFAGNINEQRKLIEAKVTQIEYTEMTPESRAALQKQLDIAVSNPPSAPEAKAAESEVNVILSRAFSDSKIVCHYERPTGSNMKTRICITAAAKKRLYDETQRKMQGKDTRTISAFSGGR
jgi:hypothetical protein